MIHPPNYLRAVSRDFHRQELARTLASRDAAAGSYSGLLNDLDESNYEEGRRIAKAHEAYEEACAIHDASLLRLAWELRQPWE